MAETIPADVIGQLRQALAEWKKLPSYQKLVDLWDGVFARFRPVFSPDHVGEITEEEFRPFLRDKNNHHWSGLHRSGPRLCSDMDALRKALVLLLDESQPLATRLDEATAMVSGMGKNLASAILIMAYPDRYGVWNNRSESVMRRLDIWPKFHRGESFGNRYAKVNEILLQISAALDIDLWTLDYLWWHIDEVGFGDGSGPEPPEFEGDLSPDEKGTSQRFGLERHLHDFLRDNWEQTSLGKDWVLYGEPGDEAPGYEYPCDVGRIDLLAKHREQPKWLVVEVKRNQASDTTVGQVLRYMGWVKNNLAMKDDEIRGMIIAREVDDALRYALSNLPNVDLKLYEVEFRLREDPGLGEK